MSEGQSDNNATDAAGEPWDLSDVPEQHVESVKNVLRQLPVPTDETPKWGLVDMRGWLETLSHYHSISKAVVLQICRVIAWCLSAPRKRGEEPSREGFQRAFIRQGGFKSLIQVLLQRLNDPEVVGASVQVSAAAIQNSPLAAEALHADGEKNVRLLMRAIERHAADGVVAEQGCHLMSNLCAFGAEVQDKHELQAVRPRGHRESQDLLVATGAVELAINVLKASLRNLQKLIKELQDLTTSTELAMQALSNLDSSDPRRAKFQAAADEGPLNRLRQKVEESTPQLAGVQGAALQALVLMCLGNSTVTRVVVGTFRSEELVKRQEQKEINKKQKEKDMEAANARLKRKGKGKGKPPVRPGKGSGTASPAPEESETGEMELPQGEERYSLTTLEGFAAALAPVADVLRGKAAEERPELAAQAARLLAVLTEHQASTVLKNLAVQSEVEGLDQLSRIGRAPDKEKQPSAPFAALVPVASAALAMLRLHHDNVGVLVAVVGAMVKLREVAMLAAPGGVSPHSPLLHKSWCAFLASVEEEDELRMSEQRLQRVLYYTDIMKRSGVMPSEAVGEGIVTLTPRLERATRQAHRDIHSLAGEALTERWRSGGSRLLTAESLARTDAASESSARQALRKGRAKSDRRMTRLESSHSISSAASLGQNSVATTPRSKSSAKQQRGQEAGAVDAFALGKGVESQDLGKVHRSGSQMSLGQVSAAPSVQSSSQRGQQRSGGAHGSKSGRKAGGGGKASAVASLMETLVEVDEQPAKTTGGWRRALGWKHDQEDFNLLFKNRIAEVMSRNFSAPSFATELPPDSPAELPPLVGLSSSLDGSSKDNVALLDTQFLEAEVGVLRARVLVETDGEVHRTWSKLRLQELEDSGQAAKAVTASLSKDLRKDGYMLPT
eukprot:CAMPEP_0178393282 /NCGR_PEP_ID=MMETSP0689_2-20121128/12106_1 /TAXON_ID=160604 /ORGANISM="Amphidinium massartii, Strain CS-259" /LENGTH=898 /DNA_ID=CAMNT_0020013867 /DNA_START=44 /DNA_END=2737 /DNA_ORIENTATION=-